MIYFTGIIPPICRLNSGPSLTSSNCMLQSRFIKLRVPWVSQSSSLCWLITTWGYHVKTQSCHRIHNIDTFSSLMPGIKCKTLPKMPVILCHSCPQKLLKHRWLTNHICFLPGFIFYPFSIQPDLPLPANYQSSTSDSLSLSPLHHPLFLCTKLKTTSLPWHSPCLFRAPPKAPK